MKLTEKLIEEILEETLIYEADNLCIFDIKKEGEGRFKAGLEFNGARSFSEFFNTSESEHAIEVVTTIDENDNSPYDATGRTVYKVDRNLDDIDSNDLNCLEEYSFDSLYIVLSGCNNVPEYTDDECDASFYGNIYVEIGDGSWALEESKNDCIQSLNRSLDHMIGSVSRKVEEVLSFGGKISVSKEKLNDLMRKCLFA